VEFKNFVEEPEALGIIRNNITKYEEEDEEEDFDWDDPEDTELFENRTQSWANG